MMAMLGLILQFILELIRALLIEVLSGHVRRSLASWLGPWREPRHRAIVRVHQHNRERLFNRLLTEDDEEQ
jgi:hypothetical protein